MQAGLEVWWQVVGIVDDFRPLATRVRLCLEDVRATAGQVQTQLGVRPSRVTTLPGVVRFVDFDNPWGNHLGFYEDIIPSDEQPEPGGSAHDENLFEVDRSKVLAQRGLDVRPAARTFSPMPSALRLPPARRGSRPNEMRVGLLRRQVLLWEDPTAGKPPLIASPDPEEWSDES